ncbi:MAG: hypothetical protein ACMXX8_02175, partial [Candidatus Woesearchaeota archaeon]
MKKIIVLMAMILIISSGCALRDPLAGVCEDDEKPEIICVPKEDLEKDEDKEIIDDEKDLEKDEDKEIIDDEKDLEKDKEEEIIDEKPTYRDDVDHA